MCFYVGNQPNVKGLVTLNAEVERHGEHRDAIFANREPSSLRLE